MFSENNEISDRQIFRQTVVGSLPLTLLFFPAVTWNLGPVVSSVYGMALWFIAVVLITAGNRMFNSKKENHISRFTKIYVKGRYLLLGAICVTILIRASKDLLLNQLNSLVILLFTGIIIYYFQCHSDEVFARFVETVFVLIIIPIAISILLGVFNIDVKQISVDIFPSKLKLWEYVMAAVICLFSFVPCGSFFIKEDRQKKIKDSPMVIIKAFTLTWVICLITNIILHLQPVTDYMRATKYPLLTMLKTVGIPGGFMERQEAVFGMFIIMALIVQTGGIIKVCTNEKKKLKGAGAIIAVIAAGLLIFVGITGDTKDLTLKRSLYAGKDIEDREYVLTIGVDKGRKGTFQVTFTVENADTKSKTYRADTFKDVINTYESRCEKMVDFTHTKLIILGKDVVESEEMLKEIKSYIKNDNIGLNVLVCKSDEEIIKLVEKSDKITKDFGIYVSDLLIKSGYDKINAAYIFGHDLEKIMGVLENKAAKIIEDNGIPIVE